MPAINEYDRQLTPDEIAAGRHRDMVGGLWEEMGELQFAFLRAQGLRPDHDLLDIGCGSLRGGVKFVRYLESGRYHGLDVNASLVEAGRRELAEAGLAGKEAHLLVSDRFEAWRFGRLFDFAIAQSVFSHLPMNHIVRCLRETARVLEPEGRFYATFFEAPTSVYLEPLRQNADGCSHYDADPYHYSFEELRTLAALAGLRAEYVGDWRHPRNQKMACFARAPEAAAR